MAVRSVSLTVKSRRIQLGITQEDLADGIMDRRTLARIEKGEIMPSKLKLEMLLEKLGLSPFATTDIYASDAELAYHMTISALDVALADGLMTESARLIHNLESDKSFVGDRLYKQYLWTAKAALAMLQNDDKEIILQMLTNAMASTRKVYQESKLAEYFLTDIDYKILSIKASQYFENNQPEKALAILHGLKDNIDAHCIDILEKGRRYPQVIYNLTKLLGAVAQSKNEYMPIIVLCNAGKKVCLDTGLTEFLPYILLNKACAYHALEEKDTTVELLTQAYHLFAAFEKPDERNMIKDYALGIGIVL